MTTRTRLPGTLDPTRSEGLTTSMPRSRPGGFQGVQGIQGIQGIQGVQGIQGYTGPVGEGEGGLFFLSRTALLGAIIASDVFAVRTAGFANPGDGGDGLYFRMGSPPTLTTNKGYAQSANGVWFQLVIEGDEYRAEQFGGQGNYVDSGNRGTDNYQAVLDYVEFSPTHSLAAFPTYKLRPKLRFSARKYWVSQGFDFATQVHLYGPASGTDVIGGLVSGQLIFPTAACCFIFQSNSTGPGQTATSSRSDSAGGSVVRGMRICQETLGVQGAAPNAHGVQMRTPVYVLDCVFDAIAGDAVHIQTALIGGNCNKFVIDNIAILKSWGHGVFVWGNDSNAGFVTRVYTKDCGKCGICEISGLGNYYSDMEIDGYGNGGVHHLGEYYQLISREAVAGVAPASAKAHWYHLGAGAPTFQFVEWDSGKTYTVDDLKLPIYQDGSSNTSAFYSVYSEGGGVKSHIGGEGFVMGGNIGTTNKSHHLRPSGGVFVSPKGIGGYKQFVSGDPGYITHGGFIGAQIGTSVIAQFDEGMDLLTFVRGLDDRTYFRYTESNNIACRWGTGSNTDLWGWTGPLTTSAVGSGKLFAADIALRNPLDSSDFRIFGVRTALPTNPGVYPKGTFFRGDNGTSWRVSTGGGIANGAWVSGIWSGGEIARTSAGRFYRNEVFANSTVEPTHTSGTVTVGGATWTYLTSTDAAFTLVQDVVRQTSAYSTSNVSTDRSFDANATTLDEVADVLGTLIADLKLAGVLT